MDWIEQAQDRNQWRGFTNTVMNLWVPRNAGSSRVAIQLTASQEGLSSMKLVKVTVIYFQG
jgi:hypothetical protein